MSLAASLGPISRPRRPWRRAPRALAAGRLTVGFLGGSITAPHTGTRWPEPFTAWLADRFPGVRLVVENAAIGATGSDLGAFRAAPEIIARGCDLVFVEYAVNDYGTAAVRRQRTREGTVRQLLAAGIDVVFVYTFCPEMLPDMEAGRVPATIAEFEALAEHYGIGSVWVGAHALQEVRRGRLAWSDWLPDGLHPDQRGSLLYAEAVIDFCAAALTRAEAAPGDAPRPLPPALEAGCWENVSLLALDAPELTGPWTLRRWTACAGVDRALVCTVPGAGLRLAFAGRGLVLGFSFGRLSSEVRYRVDGGAWQVTARDRPAWCGDHGWYRPTCVADDLPPGRHQFELETLDVPFEGGRGTVTVLALLGLIH